MDVPNGYPNGTNSASCVHHIDRDEVCAVRTMALVEELGMITHIFSDKTGGLMRLGSVASR